MKHLLLTWCFALCAIYCYAQNEELANSVAGSANLYPAIFKTYEEVDNVHSIRYSPDGDASDLRIASAVFLSDIKDQSTVVLIKVTSNLGYAVGFAPSIVNGQYNGSGSVVIYKRANGEAIELYNVTKPMERANNFQNEFVEAIRLDKNIVFVRNKFLLHGIMLGGFTFEMPDKYFNFK